MIRKTDDRTKRLAGAAYAHIEKLSYAWIVMKGRPRELKRRRPIAARPDATTMMAPATSQSPDDPRAVGTVWAVGTDDGCGAREGLVDGTPAAAASAVKVKLPEIG